jgi:hypothetical protein
MYKLKLRKNLFSRAIIKELSSFTACYLLNFSLAKDRENRRKFFPCINCGESKIAHTESKQ